MKPPYTIEDDAVDAAVAARLLEAALAPTRLGKSQLVGTFGSTHGFGLVFGANDRAAAATLAPGLAPFLDLVCPRSQLRAHRLPRSLLRRSPTPQPPSAFYVNALVLDGGAEVGAHIDGTLGPALGAEGRTPAFVSVLYLEVPPPPAGELVLLKGPLVVARLPPTPRRLVTFDGRLGHAVKAHPSPVEGERPRRRVSLVCEHYRATSEERERLGPPRLHSRSQGPVFPRTPSAGTFGDLIRPRQRTKDSPQ